MSLKRKRQTTALRAYYILKNPLPIFFDWYGNTYNVTNLTEYFRHPLPDHVTARATFKKIQQQYRLNYSKQAVRSCLITNFTKPHIATRFSSEPVPSYATNAYHTSAPRELSLSDIQEIKDLVDKPPTQSYYKRSKPQPYSYPITH